MTRLSFFGTILLLLTQVLTSAQTDIKPLRDAYDKKLDGQISPEDLEKILAGIKASFEKIPGGCLDNAKIQSQIAEIGNRLDAFIRENRIEEGKRYLSVKLSEFKREISKIKRIDARLRQVEKKIDRFNHMIKNANETDFQKLESVRNRLTTLYEKALAKRNSCQINEAATLLREVEKIGDKVRNEIKKDANLEEKAKQALKKGEELLDRVRVHVDSEKEKEILQKAEKILQGAKADYNEGEYHRTLKAMGHLRKMAQAIHKQKEIQNKKEELKSRHEDLLRRTKENLNKAKEISDKSDRDGIKKAVDKANSEMDKAEKMHRQGKYGRSIEHLKRANKISRKIKKSSRINEDIHRVIQKLERRMERVSGIIKESESREAMDALEEARSHLDKARELAGSKNNSRAAKEAKLVVRLLGKAIHLTDRKNLSNNPRVISEIKKNREDILRRVQRIKESDNPEAKDLAKKAMRHLSKAKNLAKNNHNKRALKQLFRAGELSERAIKKLESDSSHVEPKDN